MMNADTVEIKSLPLLDRGKVRDIYEFDKEHLLLVVSDRLSAFDVVFDQPIPDKGRILNAVSHFWFEHFAQIIPNHTTIIDPRCIAEVNQSQALAQRCSIVKRAQVIPIEAIVRGYLSGSGWKEYCETGNVCGIQLPTDLKIGSQLPTAIFTPSTKAQAGLHDQNINFDECSDLIGKHTAEQIRDISLTLYRQAVVFAKQKNIIIADTKFEFGLDKNNQLMLIDEVLTPDSSRFWDANSYKPGNNPISFDKQFIRDYLENIGWDKKPPAPHLPDEIIAKTSEKYRYLQKHLLA